MTIPYIDDVAIRGKRVMLREDLNVPLASGKVTSDARIRAALPTIEYALAQNSAVLVVSHLGRPTEGAFDPNASLRPVAERLSVLLKKPVHFVNDWINGVELSPGDVVLAENVRFLEGEKANDPLLAKRMAALVDVFVMDAFATAHRSAASTTGVADYVTTACGGLLLKSEMRALEAVWHAPKRPVVAIVGGAKVSTKFGVLKALMDKVDYLIPGGGIANTFLAAKGYQVADSLFEPGMVEHAQSLLREAKAHGAEILLPKDVVVASELSDNATTTVCAVDQIKQGMIVDIGPQAINDYSRLMAQTGTILWNGPVGVFETPAFAEGTRALTHAIAASPAYSVAGGGDTVAAIESFGVSEAIAYISTGGGAFLELLEKGSLPAIDALAT